MLNDPETEVSPNASSRLAERVGLKYLCALAILPVLAYLLPFPLFHYDLFPALQHSFWGDILEYGYHTAGENADVVIFGDSSAVFADDPTLLAETLHLKVLNIPNSRGSLPVIQDEPLKRYLATNKPPRLIVFQFSPWGLDAGSRPNVSMYEGEEVLLRHGNLRQILAFGHRYPLELLAFPFRYYAVHIKRKTGDLRHGTINLGHADYFGPQPLPDDCRFEDKYLQPSDSKYVRDLAAKYRTPQTRTMIYLSAIPACTRAKEIAAVPYPGLYADAPALLPANTFASDGNFAHILPAGVAASTRLLAGAIEKALTH